MSALGHKRTYAAHKLMSALPPIATAKADIGNRSCLLFPKSGHVQRTHPCLLWAKSGHSATSPIYPRKWTFSASLWGGKRPIFMTKVRCCVSHLTYEGAARPIHC